MIKRTIHIILAITSLLLQFDISAQDYNYKQYTVDDGLPSNYVYGVIEDNDGLIWIYTENGISKFDGYNFKNYSVENGLISNDIVQLVKDSSGIIWLLDLDCTISFIRNDSIINIYEAGAEEIVRCGFGSISDHVSYFRILKNESDSLKQSHYFLNNGECVDSVYSGLTYNFGEEGASNYAELYGSFMTTENQFSLGRDLKHLYEFPHEIQSRIVHEMDCRNDSFVLLDAHYIHSNNPFLIVIGEKEFFIIDLKTRSCKFYKWSAYFENASPFDAIELLDSTILLHTNKGYVHLDYDQNVIASRDLSHLAKDFWLRRSYIDQKRNLWIGTKEGGLFFLSSAKQSTESLLDEFGNSIYCEFLTRSNKGELLAISNQGDIYEVSNYGRLKKLKSAVENNDVKTFCYGKDSSLIISTSGRIISFKNDKFSKFSDDLDLFDHVSQFANFTNIIYSDKNNRYYYTKYKETYIVDESNVPGDFRVISTGDRKLFYDTKQDKTYAAKKDGLFRIYNDSLYEKLIDLKLISSFYVFSDNVLWLGTESSGVFSFDLNTKELVKIANYNFVRKIIQYQDQFLFATNKGVYQSKLEEEKLVELYNYNLKDGLPALEVRDVIIHQDRLYIGTHQGLVKMIIRNVTTQNDSLIHSKKNPLKFTGVTNMDTDIHIGVDSSFMHDQNDFSFSYRLLNYESEGDIEYFYKLDPIQSDWHSTKERTHAFPNLQAGDYSFNLRAKDAFSNVYQVDKPYNFEIKKPFYNTMLFYISTFLIACGGFYFFEKRRLKNQKEKLERKTELNKKMANIKLEALRSQMNPHFIFNSLGAIQYHIQTHRIDEADNYLTLFAQLMRKYLNSSSQNTIFLKEEISLLEDYVDLEMMRFENMFTTKIIVDPKIDINGRDIPPMMIQPYVENAINHGLPSRKDNNGLLEIEFIKVNDEHLIVEIRDNGIGIEKSKLSKGTKHVSKGMENVKNRIRFLKTIGIVDVEIEVLANSMHANFPGTNIRLNLNFQRDEV